MLFADASEDYNDIGKCIELIDINNEKIVAGLHVIAIKPLQTFATGFLSKQFKSTSIRKQIYKIAQGVSVLGISKSSLKTLFITFPTLAEQEKIAEFLSAVESRVQKLGEKLEALKRYKKGVMQQIFSQEIRFKDDRGNPFPNWEKKKLGEIGKYYNGLSGKTAVDFGSGEPYIQYKQIFDNNYINDDYGFVLIKKDENQSKVKYGDVLFTTSSETPDEVAMSSVFLTKRNENIYLNSFSFGFRINSFNIFNPQFARFFLRSYPLRKKIFPLAQGSTRYNISKLELMKLKIHLPPLPEQKKIADFLSSIDKKIELTQQELEHTECYKKGLLQRMFV